MLELVLQFIEEITKQNYTYLEDLANLIDIIHSSDDSSEKRAVLQTLRKWKNTIDQQAQDNQGTKLVLQGLAYHYGIGIKKDYKIAEDLYKQAIQLNNGLAMNNLGLMYQEGQGVEKNYQEAIKWYEKASHLDNSVAMVNLGFMYQKGQEVKKNYQEAIKWYKKASSLDNNVAMNNLGFMYRTGQGVEKNYQEAIKWYEKAGDLGNSVAMINLGFMYRIGQGVKENYQEAIKWYEKASNRGSSVAMLNLGFMYHEGCGVEVNYQEAIKWYEKSSNLGNTSAMNNLGFMYSQGQEVEVNYQEAIKWYEKSSNLGNTCAMNNLGFVYFEGQGVEKNYQEAIKWYEKSSNLGDSNAMNSLGVIYQEEENYQEAIKWYEKASNLDNSNAMENLGSLYELGQGVEENQRKAAQLYRRAKNSVSLNQIYPDVYWTFHRERLAQQENEYLNLLSQHPELLEEVILFEGQYFPTEAITLLDELTKLDDAFFAPNIEKWIDILVKLIPHQNDYPKMLPAIYDLMLNCLQLLETKNIKTLQPWAYHQLIIELYTHTPSDNEGYSDFIEILAKHTSNLLHLIEISEQQEDNYAVIEYRLLANILTKQALGLGLENDLGLHKEITKEYCLLINGLLASKGLLNKEIIFDLISAGYAKLNNRQSDQPIQFGKRSFFAIPLPHDERHQSKKIHLNPE